MPSAAAPGAPDLSQAFAAQMAALGPFEPAPRLAIGLSGGADSTALALLASSWARARNGTLLALIVDHGIRPESAAEARLTQARMVPHGIAAEILPLTTLTPGAALQARARDARHAALRAACRAHGIAHLLLAHHAADQAETVALRQAGGSGATGLAAMAALDETAELRLLRPLLATPPAALRDHLRQAGTLWLEDPSNANPIFARAKLRRDLTPEAYDQLLAQSRQAATERQAATVALAQELAARVTFSPLGFALIAADHLSPLALAAVIRTVAARIHAPPLDATARLAAQLRPCTLAGARIAPAGSWHQGGWLVLREQPPPPTAAVPGAHWAGFVLEAPTLPPGLTIAPHGPSTRSDRATRAVPDIVMRRLPALWHNTQRIEPPGAHFRPVPPRPAAAAPWVSVEGQGRPGALPPHPHRGRAPDLNHLGGAAPTGVYTPSG